MEASIKTFYWAVCLGAGFRIGWGIIGLIVWVLAKSLGSGTAFLN